MIRIDLQALGTLVSLLRKEGYRVLGPTVRDHAIVYDEIRSFEDLPIGWTDEQNLQKLLFSGSAQRAF